jgi:phage major head subunit gpT-like protein
MSAKGLGSRAIIGEYYKTLEQSEGQSWLRAVSMLFTSDQDSETYKWLGQTPAMREWVGGRQAKGFRENGITIINKHYEATMEVLLRELRRDKTGQVLVRVQEMARRTNAHWASLLSTLIINAESTACYDGQYFFDTDHSEGDSGTQSNDLSVTIASLPIAAAEQGTTTAPSARTMKASILKGVQAIMGFVDDQGEPMNENANSFVVMVPTTFMDVTNAAINNTVLSGAETNDLASSSNFKINFVVNPRLSAWTTKFAVFRTDGSVKPFIRQQETDVIMKAIAEGSDLEFNEDKHHYGVDAWRNVGYGYWQHGCLVTLA